MITKEEQLLTGNCFLLFYLLKTSDLVDVFLVFSDFKIKN